MRSRGGPSIWAAARRARCSVPPHPRCAARGVAVRDAIPGRAIDLGGGATLTLLGPPQPALRGTRSDVNANSVVARIDYGSVSMLFCGDAEAETERWLLGSGRPLRARVVK